MNITTEINVSCTCSHCRKEDKFKLDLTTKDLTQPIDQEFFENNNPNGFMLGKKFKTCGVCDEEYFLKVFKRDGKIELESLPF